LLGYLDDAGQWDADHHVPLLAAAVIVPSLVGSILNWPQAPPKALEKAKSGLFDECDLRLVCTMSGKKPLI
jgi:hypothetical protein